MAESLILPSTNDRFLRYEALYPQIQALLAGESDAIANMANVAAALKESFHFFWVGFYLVKENQLVLGPFQGPIACTRIAFQRGVCGHCYTTRASVLVPNVDEFPGHIACSSLAKSEVVIPVWNAQGEITAVLDVDSDRLADFSVIDVEQLEKIVKLLT
jgi:L-methionine (R)-S-oxide reductase